MAAATSALQSAQPAFPVPVITNELQLGKVTRAYSSTQYLPAATFNLHQTGITELALPLLVQWEDPIFARNLANSLVTILPSLPDELLELIAEYYPPEVELLGFPGILEDTCAVLPDRSIPIPRVIRVPYMTVMIVHPPVDASLPAPEQLLSFYRIDNSHACCDFAQSVSYARVDGPSVAFDCDFLDTRVSSSFTKVTCHSALPQYNPQKPYACHSDHLSVPYNRENRHVDLQGLTLYHRMVYAIPTTEKTKAPMDAFSLHSYVLEHAQELREIMGEWSRRHSLSVAKIDQLYCAVSPHRKPSLLRQWTALMGDGVVVKDPGSE